MHLTFGALVFKNNHLTIMAGGFLGQDQRLGNGEAGNIIFAAHQQCEG